MKIALIQDELVRKGGAEQVVLSFQRAFPKAPIYTLSYNSEKTYPEFKRAIIKTSWLGKVIKKESNIKRFFYPFGVWAMRSMDLTQYDVVLISTTHCAKYIKVGPNTLVLTYCHTPFRLAWRPDSYERIAEANPFMKMLYSVIIKSLQRRDKASAERTDWFLTNSVEVVPRIESAYEPRMPITVINPAVKCKNFYVSDQVQDYYLVVSRFESYKKVDLVLEAFNQLPNKKLVVVGNGSMDEQLRKMAGPNVVFRSGLDAKTLSKLFAECKALIFPQHEDYGITPLEANASGRPVIAYGFGGIRETMIPFVGDSLKSSALFFNEQTVGSLLEAIETFETLDFNPSFIRKHAESFDESIFIKKIQDFVHKRYATRFSEFKSTYKHQYSVNVLKRPFTI